jgi:subtilisin family serine protease
MSFAHRLVKLHHGKKEYNLKDLKKIKTDDKQLFSSVEYLKTWMALGLYPADASAYFEQLSGEYNYQYNLDFDPRYIVGDNWEENPTPYYGNNDVAGPSPGHGTFVAGCVGAERNNGIGVNGVAGNVRLMIVRVVPDGDERDKDVANAIKYAVNNGAKVVNMSFGKAYSPQKSFVDEALKLAESKDVLLVHASGNDGVNNDIITHYPENIDDNGTKLVNCWLTVGASSVKAGEDLAADFSNYGKKTVDVFAPGVDVWGLKPGNGYEAASGTSMACPVVSGLAAVIRGYFPKLNAAEVRDIIIKSCVRFDEEVNCPSESETRSKINFTELSVGGGVVNLYRAVQLADELMKTKGQ